MCVCVWLRCVDISLQDVLGRLELGASDTRVGIATFSDTTEVQFHLSTYQTREDILHAIEYIPFRDL